MPTDNRLQVRLDPELAEWLVYRSEVMATGSTDLQGRTELALWRAALAGELRRIRLTLNQACCIADVLHGSLLSPSLAALIYLEASDAFQMARDTPLPNEPSYGEKWGIDEDALLLWLARLSSVADHALRDAFARWRLNEGEASVAGFAAAGLIVVDAAE